MHSFSILVVLVSGGAAILAGCSGDDETAGAAGAAMPPRTVETTVVTRTTMRDVLDLVGSVEANERAEIRAEISGIIDSINFEEGQQVAAGDVLARVDSREIRAQIDETESRLELARITRDRNRRLIASNSIPQADVDQAEAEVAGLEAGLERLRVLLSKTEITAPFDGVTGARHLSPGDFIDPTRPLTTVVDSSPLKLSFLVPERYYDMLEIGGEVQIGRGGGGASPTRGEIYFISSVVDPDTRAAEVKAWIEDPPPNLRPGMFSELDLILEVHEDTLAVPEQAILAGAMGDSLVVVGESAEPVKPITVVPVQAGLRANGLVEVAPIEHGAVTEGTEIVAAGVGALPLMTGMQVKPVPMRPIPEKTGSRLTTGTYEEMREEAEARQNTESPAAP